LDLGLIRICGRVIAPRKGGLHMKKAAKKKATKKKATKKAAKKK